MLDEPDDDRQEDPLGGDRLRHRGPPRPRQARDLEPDRDPGRGARESRPSGRARVRRRAATAPSSRPWPTPWSSYLAPVRERYQELRADEAALERTLADGRREGAGDRRRDAGRRARRRWGSGPVRAPRTNVCGRELSPDLELDLDVFAGPFDLLLTLILREEVDLLEVDLADVVITYIDHLERRGELDLEAATEFLVLIAALLELKIAAAAARRGARGASSSTPARRPRSCSRGCSPPTATAPRPATCASGCAPRSGYRFRSAPLPPSLRRASLQDAARRL